MVMMDAGEEGMGGGVMKGEGRERVNTPKHAALSMKTHMRNVL
jgi:hypothetical protein